MCFAFLVSCQTAQIEETKSVEAPKKKIVLAWGESHQDWTDHLVAEIDKAKWNPAIENYCKTVSLKECVAQAISILSKYESGFNPKEEFIECKKDKCIYKECFQEPTYGHCMMSKDKKPIRSRGLFQLSIGSVNGRYKCGIKTQDELFDPYKNISCMVNIANYWLNEDKVFFGGDRLGLGQYHSVGRASSKSSAKIKTYLENFK